MKKGKLHLKDGTETNEMYNIPDGIISHPTTECGGNVHDHHVVEITFGSFEEEIYSEGGAIKNIVDVETDSYIYTKWRSSSADIPHTKNNWVCYDFKERRIAPSHYAIRTYGPGTEHLKSWLVETSADGENWREVARQEDNKQLKDSLSTGTIEVAKGAECRFIRLVNIGRNHAGHDNLRFSAWEIFGSLIE
jgi:hypothetical protein